MKIYLNGKEDDIGEVKTLKELVSGRLQLNVRTVVIEHNREVVPRDAIDSVPLKEGDRVEIVHFVGGGSEVPDPAPKPAKKARAKKAPAPRKGPSNLVIVESPAKAKTINKFLGKDYHVEASMGHVRDLPKSKMGVDVANDFLPHYIIISKARKRVNQLKKLAQGKTGIYLAPDPDREGEAISWHLAHIFTEGKGEKAPVIHRVVFNEITKEAVQRAFVHPRTIEMNLVYAQQARRILDRIVGYELSPLLWRNVGRGLSAGRVQSVALRLIVDREREILAFVAEEYWSLEAKLSSQRPEARDKVFVSKLERIGEEKIRLKNAEETEAIRREILTSTFRVDKVDKSERKRRPQAPFTTSKLQQEAYNRLGFPAAKTMSIAQKLYEGIEIGDEGSVGLITYMRTDSVNIAVSAQKEAIDYIRGKYGPPFLPETPPVYKSKKGAQEAHEAIRPSSVLREPGKIKSFLGDDEYRLYDLIWRKFVASQMTPAVDENVSVSIAAGEKYFFKTTGRRNLFAGFDLVYSGKEAGTEEDEKEANGEESAEEGLNDLPDLQVNEILKLHELAGFQHFTKPPARYNDASIVKTLEEKGIGRPSTYAPTIYTIVSRGYVDRQSGALHPTELGMIVVDLLTKHFPKIMDIQFTAGMEEELDKIEEGEMDWIAVLKDFYAPFHELLTAAKEQMVSVKQSAEPTGYTCDICGKAMVIKWGRFGKFLACMGFPDCKYTRSIPTGFRCPQPECGGELVKRMSKRRRMFYGCSNYPKCTYIANKLPAAGNGANPPDEVKKILENGSGTANP